MNVYLVYREHVQPDGGSNEDVIAVFADREDADKFVLAYEFEYSKQSVCIEVRTLIFGQAPHLGYVK